MSVALSCVYPIFNRADLFARTLDTFVLQDMAVERYEILVMDDGSTDHLVEVVRYYAARWGLPIRYFRLDVLRCGVPVWRSLTGGNSPVVAWNVGIKEARGRRIAISSPEVCHRDSGNADWLAQPYATNIGIVANVYDRTWAATEFHGWIGGGPAHRPLPFLAAYDRDFLVSIGGFEEAFMAGRAFDDNEFAERFAANGGRYEFEEPPDLVAEHLPHDRPDAVLADQVNHETYQRLRGQLVANVGRTWGNPACILEAW